MEKSVLRRRAGAPVGSRPSFWLVAADQGHEAEAAEVFAVEGLTAAGEADHFLVGGRADGDHQPAAFSVRCSVTVPAGKSTSRR